MGDALLAPRSLGALTSEMARLLTPAFGHEAEQEAERSRMRKSQVGTGDRSAKIRTYNYPQSRITDHRIGFTTHDLPGVMDGHIEPVIEALRLADVEEQLDG